MNVVERTGQIADQIASSLGIRVYNVEYKKEGSDWFLRVFIYKQHGISMDDCETVSRSLETQLDQEDFIPHAYYLEVSSPGIERVLKADWHFDTAIGQLVSIHLFKPLGHSKKRKGILMQNLPDSIVVDQEIIQKSLISKANVVFSENRAAIPSAQHEQERFE